MYRRRRGTRGQDLIIMIPTKGGYRRRVGRTVGGEYIDRVIGRFVNDCWINFRRAVDRINSVSTWKWTSAGHRSTLPTALPQVAAGRGVMEIMRRMPGWGSSSSSSSWQRGPAGPAREPEWAGRALPSRAPMMTGGLSIALVGRMWL